MKFSASNLVLSRISQRIWIKPRSLPSCFMGPIAFSIRTFSSDTNPLTEPNDTTNTPLYFKSTSPLNVTQLKENNDIFKLEALKKWIFQFTTPQRILRLLVTGLSVYSPDTQVNKILFTPDSMRANASSRHVPNTISEPLLIVASNFGDGLGLDSDGVVHAVKGANVGDTVKSMIVASIHGLAKGHLQEVIQTAQPPDLPLDGDHPRVHSYKNAEVRRETPLCKHFKECFGCQFQHLSYRAELHEKIAFVTEVLQERADELNISPEKIAKMTKTIKGKTGTDIYGYKTFMNILVPGVPQGKTLERIHLNGLGKVPFLSHGPDIQSCELVIPQVNDTYKSLRDDWIGKVNYGDTDVLAQHIRLRETLVPSQQDLTIKQFITAQKQHRKMYLHSVTRAARARAQFRGPATLQEAREQDRLQWDKKMLARTGTTLFELEESGVTFVLSFNSVIPDQHVVKMVTRITQTRIAALRHELGLGLKTLVVPYASYGLYPLVFSNSFEHIHAFNQSDDSFRRLKQNVYLNTSGYKIAAHQLAITSPNDLRKSLSEHTVDPNDTVLLLSPPRQALSGMALQNILRFKPRVIYYISESFRENLWDIQYLTGGGSIGRSGCNAMKRAAHLIDPYYASPEAAQEYVKVMNRNSRQIKASLPDSLMGLSNVDHVNSSSGEDGDALDVSEGFKSKRVVYDLHHVRVVDGGSRTKNIVVLYTLIRKDDE